MKPVLLAIPLIVLLGVGCAEQETVSNNSPEVTAAGLTAEELGVIGAEIRRSPERAEQILAERGLDEERFEDAVREVAADPDTSERYRRAFEQAGGAAAGR